MPNANANAAPADTSESSAVPHIVCNGVARQAYPEPSTPHTIQGLYAAVYPYREVRVDECSVHLHVHVRICCDGTIIIKFTGIPTHRLARSALALAGVRFLLDSSVYEPCFPATASHVEGGVHSKKNMPSIRPRRCT